MNSEWILDESRLVPTKNRSYSKAAWCTTALLEAIRKGKQMATEAAPGLPTNIVFLM
jgi:hypothetical protein